jgi:hypothetical protein
MAVQNLGVAFGEGKDVDWILVLLVVVGVLHLDDILQIQLFLQNGWMLYLGLHRELLAPSGLLNCTQQHSRHSLLRNHQILQLMTTDDGDWCSEVVNSLVYFVISFFTFFLMKA